MQALSPHAPLQGGKYKIERVLGQGGFGITYLAIQTGLERYVAIKEFFIKEFYERNSDGRTITVGNHATSNRYKEKFLKEARNIAKLNHPNIIRVIDVFEEGGTAYYVMEYASKGSLLNKVKREGPLPEEEAIKYIREISYALIYLHQNKMSHLDVKPGNVILDECDRAILIDFGTAKQYDLSNGKQTSTTPVGISAGYAPMEQYSGVMDDFSPQADIYALGATLYFLLTETTPPNAFVINTDGVPTEELELQEVSSASIDAICMAMEPNKQDRPETVEDFLLMFDEEGYNKRKDDKMSNSWSWYLIELIAILGLSVVFFNGGLGFNEYAYDNGLQYLEERDTIRAFEWFKIAGKLGNANAQFNLGRCYSNGIGVAKDEAKAVEWYQKSADQGDAAAQCNLGVCYESGHGVVKDEAKAVEWYQKSADQGDAAAQCNLGTCYRYGHGVAKDEAKAIEWYQKAVDQGYEDALRQLKTMK